MAQMYGYSEPQQIEGARLGELLARSVPENVEYLRDFIRSGYQLTDAESQEVDRYGDTRYFLNSLIGTVEDGLLVLAWGTQKDVTENKRVEEQVLFQARLLDQVQAAVIATDLEGKVTHWNEHAEKLYGWSREEALGRNIIELMIGPMGAEAAEEIMQKLRAGEPREDDFPVRRKDGSTFLAHVSNSLIYDARGRAVGIVGVSTDITERRRVEQAVRESEERYRAVIEQAADGILLVDVDTRRILEANPVYRDLLGYAPEEILGLTLYDVVPYSREAMDCYVERVLEQGSYVSGERRHRRRDGSLVDVEVSANVISYGGREALCVMVRDITERKQAEEALKESEVRFRRLAEGVDFIPWEADLTTWQFTYVGPQAVQILGYPLED